MKYLNLKKNKVKHKKTVLPDKYHKLQFISLTFLKITYQKIASFIITLIIKVNEHLKTILF